MTQASQADASFSEYEHSMVFKDSRSDLHALRAINVFALIPLCTWMGRHSARHTGMAIRCPVV